MNIPGATRSHGALFHRPDGPSGCPLCGWSGVPTFLRGVRQDTCPCCEVEYPPAPKPHAGTPRNAPCPCGSGKKYKKCCGA